MTMKRIRLLSYYRSDGVPASWLAAKLIARFLPDELNSKYLRKPEIQKMLWEKCLQAFSGGVAGFTVDEIATVIAGALASAEHPDSMPGLSEEATTAMNRVLTRVNEYLRSHTLEGRDILTMWSLGDALMPFTDTSIPVLVRVRRCWCGCWVRVESKECPFCNSTPPGGSSRRAWTRDQVRIQQPANNTGTPLQPRGRAIPPDLAWDDVRDAAGPEDNEDLEQEISEPPASNGEGEVEDSDA